MKKDEIKKLVEQKYTRIALHDDPDGCCLENECCSSAGFSMIGESYENLGGYIAEADMGLGCGLPTEFAGLLPGQQVLDLGSGAGNDCFVARAIVGDTGRVTGLDFSDAMLKKAENNRLQLGYTNMEFVKGDIEQMPFGSNSFDVVISNCVLNLVPDKQKAFAEIYRVLKPGGHFCISDVVSRGRMPKELSRDAEMYAGCVSGAMEIDQYTNVIKEAGFANETIQKERKIEIPEDLLLKYLTDQAARDLQAGYQGIFSITVTAVKL